MLSSGNRLGDRTTSAPSNYLGYTAKLGFTNLCNVDYSLSLKYAVKLSRGDVYVSVD